MDDFDADDDVVTIHRFAVDEATVTTFERGGNRKLASALLPGWSIAVDALLAR